MCNRLILESSRVQRWRPQTWTNLHRRVLSFNRSSSSAHIVLIMLVLSSCILPPSPASIPSPSPWRLSAGLRPASLMQPKQNLNDDKPKTGHHPCHWSSFLVVIVIVTHPHNINVDSRRSNATHILFSFQQVPHYRRQLHYPPPGCYVFWMICFSSRNWIPQFCTLLSFQAVQAEWIRDDQCGQDVSPQRRCFWARFLSWCWWCWILMVGTCSWWCWTWWWWCW